MKIAVICHGFNKRNINKLPWKYIYKISSYLNENHDVFIITDSNDEFDELRTICVNKIFVPFLGETKEILNILDKEEPDKCIMLLGITSFLRQNFKIKVPVYGVCTSPIYSFNELLRNLGILDSIYYRKYTVIHYLNALIPNFFVKKWSKDFEKIIFLSEFTKNKLIKKGFPDKKSVLIKVGMEKKFLNPINPIRVKKLKKKINPNNVPVIMYFTSPLTLRGTDTLIKAFKNVYKIQKSKLIFLSRIDSEELYEEEKKLKDIALKNNIFESIEFISDFLSPEELKEHIAVADVVCLPFKIVLSDIPISILETMAIGKPIISTNVGCIPELVNDNGIIVPANNNRELSIYLFRLLTDRVIAKKMINKGNSYVKSYSNWTQVGKIIEKTIDK